MANENTQMTRRVLVTGAAGFIGYPALLAALEAGYEAAGFDLAPPPDLTPGTPFVRGDFTDRDEVDRALRERSIDTIVHTGGISGPMLSRDDPYHVCRTNIVGTMNLLEAARVGGVRRF